MPYCLGIGSFACKFSPVRRVYFTISSLICLRRLKELGIKFSIPYYYFLSAFVLAKITGWQKGLIEPFYTFIEKKNNVNLLLKS